MYFSESCIISWAIKFLMQFVMEQEPSVYYNCFNTSFLTVVFNRIGIVAA